MRIDVLLLALGLVILLKGSSLFVPATVRLAEYLHLPRLVIGSTLASLAAAVPALAIALTAGLKGESGLAVGNAVGACLCKIGLVFGVAAAFAPGGAGHRGALRPPLLAMIGFGVALFLMSLDLNLTRSRGFVLIGGGLVYFAYDVWRQVRRPKASEMIEAEFVAEESAPRKAWSHRPFGSLLQFILAAGLVGVGSHFLVDSAVNLAAMLGIPSLLIGFTVLAVGTSLPELVTAVGSSRKGIPDRALENLLGSNVANLSVVAGTAAALSGMTLSRLMQLYNFTAMLVIFLVFSGLLLTGQRISRAKGILLLGLYGVYAAALVLLTAVFRH